MTQDLETMDWDALLTDPECWDSDYPSAAGQPGGYRETGALPGLDVLLPGYSGWRPGQAEAVQAVVDWMLEREGLGEWQGYYGRACLGSPDPSLYGSRFLQVEAPTGSGKSVIAVAAARALGRGCVVLTATRQLQDQYANTIPGAVTLKGKTAFGCPRFERRSPGMTASEASALCGFCPMMRDGRCSYWRQYFRALSVLGRGGVVVCNYAKWATLVSDDKFNLALEHTAPLLVMDESDRLVDVATSAGSFDQPFRWLEDVAGLRDYPRSGAEDDWADWLPGAVESMAGREGDLRAEADELAGSVQSSDQALARFRSLSGRSEEIRRAAEVLSYLDGSDFVCRPFRSTAGGAGGWDGVELLPVAPSDVFSSVVDRDSCGHVLMMSATPLPPLMLHRLLDVRPLSLTLEPVFDPGRAPIRVSRRAVTTSYAARRKDPRLISEWAEATLGEVVAARERDPELNALVYARSGANRDALVAAADAMGMDVLSYRGRGNDRERAIAGLSAGARGLTLLGTGVERGVSLDGDACRLVVLGKAPVLPPVSEDKLAGRRAAMFPSYREVMEAADFAQVVGRAMRSEDDWCEVVITDGLWGWWVRDRKQYLPADVRARLSAGAQRR